VTAFGNERRQVELVKMRAMPVHGGRHDMVLETGGLRVFPRLMPAPRAADARSERHSTGVASLDSLLGATGVTITDEEVALISPLAYAHVIPNGTYFFDHGRAEEAAVQDTKY
jgi:hypothetical protein